MDPTTKLIEEMTEVISRLQTQIRDRDASHAEEIRAMWAELEQKAQWNRDAAIRLDKQATRIKVLEDYIYTLPCKCAYNDLGNGKFSTTMCARCSTLALAQPARNIITSYVHPPIPIRSMDWIAYYEDTEETGPFGSGRTEVDAIQSLREYYDV